MKGGYRYSNRRKKYGKVISITRKNRHNKHNNEKNVNKKTHRKKHMKNKKKKNSYNNGTLSKMKHRILNLF